MKKIISMLILVCMLAFSLAACSTNENKRDRALDLINRGKYEEAYEIFKDLADREEAEKYLEHFYFIPVKVVSNGDFTLELTYSDGHLPTKINRFNGIHTTITDNVYNSDGNLAQSTVTDVNDNSATINKYTYDTVGNLIQSSITYTDSEVSGIIDYTYDSNGNLIKEVRTENYGSNRGSIARVFDYTYDDNGNLIKEVSSMMIGDDVTSEREYSYTYDANGNLLKCYSGDYIYLECEYDANGNLIKETRIGFTYEYSYDSDGNLIKFTQSDGGGISITQEYTYDSNGNLIKETYEDRDMCEYTIDYEYDHNGNLVKEITTEVLNKKSTVEYTYNKFGAITNITETKSDGTVYSLDFEWKLVYIPGELPEELVEWVNIVDTLK